MLKKTHLAVGVLIGLYFIRHMNNQVLFMGVLLVSSILPDADRFFGFRNLAFWKKHEEKTARHRGVLHTYTFCIFISVLSALFVPILALPFFLGYSTHVFADSFTPNGIKPFWPLKFVSKGQIPTASKRETMIFWVLIFVNVLLFAFFFL